MLKIGERAPEFTLPDHTGADRSLTEFLGLGALILFFYPAEFAGPAVALATALRDLYPAIEAAGLCVAGVSPQSPATHANFRARYRLPFVLLSDPIKTVVKMYGVNGPLGLGVRRATFLLDGGRRVRDVARADFRVHRLTELVRKAILLRGGAA
jgi:peroxiredoxin Q/BCP